MSTQTDLLRRAAAKARETAQAATPGVCPEWHPGVAEAVAVWLEQHALYHDTYECDSHSETGDCPAQATARALVGEES